MLRAAVMDAIQGGVTVLLSVTPASAAASCFLVTSLTPKIESLSSVIALCIYFSCLLISAFLP